MLTTIIIIALVLWCLGFLGEPAGFRSWGGGYGYPGIGAIIVVVLVLAVLHVI